MTQNQHDSGHITIITVDGPGGSGKGTLSQKLAESLGFHFLDSGAIYRLLALAAIRSEIDILDEKAVENLAHSLEIRFDPKGDIYLSNTPVTTLIRTENCGNTASRIAVFPKVRKALLSIQRAFAKPPGLIADGRDMGTVVFPNAQLKIYLEASAETRAKRRYFQLKDNGFNVNLQSLLAEIEARDTRDKQRVASPLKPAEDAIVVDTTGMGIEAVFQHVMGLIHERLYQA